MWANSSKQIPLYLYLYLYLYIYLHLSHMHVYMCVYIERYISTYIYISIHLLLVLFVWRNRLHFLANVLKKYVCGWIQGFKWCHLEMVSLYCSAWLFSTELSPTSDKPSHDDWGFCQQPQTYLLSIKKNKKTPQNTGLLFTSNFWTASLSETHWLKGRI